MISEDFSNKLQLSWHCHYITTKTKNNNNGEDINNRNKKNQNNKNKGDHDDDDDEGEEKDDNDDDIYYLPGCQNMKAWNDIPCQIFEYRKSKWKQCNTTFKKIQEPKSSTVTTTTNIGVQKWT